METEIDYTTEQDQNFSPEIQTSQMEELGKDLEMTGSGEVLPNPSEIDLGNKDPVIQVETEPPTTKQDIQESLKTFYSKDWKETPPPTEAVSSFQILEKEGSFHYVETKADGVVVDHTERILNNKDESYIKEHQEMIGALVNGGVYIKTSQEGVDIRDLDREVKVEVEKEAVYAALYRRGEDGSVSIETRVFSPDPVEEDASALLNTETNTSTQDTESENIFFKPIETFSEPVFETVITPSSYAEIGVSVSAATENSTSNFVSQEPNIISASTEQIFGIFIEASPDLLESVVSGSENTVEKVIVTEISIKPEIQNVSVKDVKEENSFIGNVSEKAPAEIQKLSLQETGIELVSSSIIQEQTEAPLQVLESITNESSTNFQSIQQESILTNSLETIGIAIQNTEIATSENQVGEAEPGFVMPEVVSIQRFEIVQNNLKLENQITEEFSMKEVTVSPEIQNFTPETVVNKIITSESIGIQIIEESNRAKEQVQTLSTQLEESNREFVVSEKNNYEASITEVSSINSVSKNSELRNTSLRVVDDFTESVKEENFNITSELKTIQEDMIVKVENTQEAVIQDQMENMDSEVRLDSTVEQEEVLKTEYVSTAVITQEKPLTNSTNKEQSVQESKISEVKTVEVSSLGIQIDTLHREAQVEEVVKLQMQRTLDGKSKNVEISNAESRVTKVSKIEASSIKVVERANNIATKTIQTPPTIKVREIKSFVSEINEPVFNAEVKQSFDQKQFNNAPIENRGIALDAVSVTKQVNNNFSEANKVVEINSRAVRGLDNSRVFNPNEIISTRFGRSRGIVIDEDQIASVFSTKNNVQNLQIAA